MKNIIVCFIFSLLFSHYTYGQQTGKFQNYKITDSVFSGMLKIESNNASKERLTMARFKILNEKSLIKDVQKIFYKSLRTLKKDKILTKCLKNDFDSLKIESSIILAYKWDGKITDVSFDLSPFIVNEVLSEDDINYISNELKTNVKIAVQTNGGHIYLDKYDSDWQISVKKKKIPITEYYKEYSKKKGYKKYVIKLHSNKYSPAIMNVNPIKAITGKQTMGEISINRIEFDSIVSNTIKEVLKHRKKYDEVYYQLKDEFEKNKTLSNIAIWYNGYGKILHCSFYVSSVVLDRILVEEDFEVISKALEEITLKINDTSQNGYTPWGDYDPEWRKGIKYISIPMIRFQ